MIVVYFKARRKVRVQFHYRDAIRRTPVVFRSLPLAQAFAKSVVQS